MCVKALYNLLVSGGGGGGEGTWRSMEKKAAEKKQMTKIPPPPQLQRNETPSQFIFLPRTERASFFKHVVER